MTVLAIDTALGACSVALLGPARNLALARSAPMQRGHAEALMPMIASLMADADQDFAGLDRIAVTVGPGTFTGLRVGLAAARGLALAAGLPAIGIGTLEAYAAGLAADDAVAVALDARKGQIYLQVFDGAEPRTEPCVCSADHAAALVPDGALLAGSGAALLADALAATGRSPFQSVPLPPGPDVLAVARLAALKPVPQQPPSPLYLRPPDARLPDARLPGARRPPAAAPGAQP